MKKISLIVAKAANNAIGYKNQLLWHLPEDLKFFKEKTLNKNILMGKNTFESILTYTKGKPLPNRKSFVLSKEDILIDNVYTFKSIEDVLNFEEDIVVIGGAMVYKLMFPYVDEMWVTEINKDFEGDTFFPEIEKNNWEEMERIKNSNAEFNFDFVFYKKIKSS